MEITSASRPSLNIIGILVGTFVCVKAATREALDDKGPLRSPKYAPAIMAPATISSGILPALAIVMSTIPMVPTVPKAVPNTMLTIAVNKKAQAIKRDGLIKSMPVAIIIGMMPAACHIAMSQPISKNICITTIEVLAPVHDRVSSSFGWYPLR